jgi:ribosomal protein S18 acetylase RimI-like enzyme
MTRLLGESFADRDPPAVAVGLSTSEFEAFVHLFGSRAATEALTIVARSTETGEMLGALLTEDLATAPPEGMDRLSSKFAPIFDILGQLDADYRAGQTIRPGDTLHLYLLGVARHAAGQGIGQQLVATCVANGADKRYRAAITEATNLTSQHLFRKHGFVERVRRSYQDHRFEGRAPFTSIATHGGPLLMERLLVRPNPRAHHEPRA